MSETLGERVAREWYGTGYVDQLGSIAREFSEQKREAIEALAREEAQKLATLVDRLSRPAPAPEAGIREAAEEIVSLLKNEMACCCGHANLTCARCDAERHAVGILSRLGASGKAGWTRERPTKPGWYWLKTYPDAVPAIHLVWYAGKRLFCDRFAPAMAIDETPLNYEWRGPLSPEE